MKHVAVAVAVSLLAVVACSALVVVFVLMQAFVYQVLRDVIDPSAAGFIAVMGGVVSVFVGIGVFAERESWLPNKESR